MDCREEAVSPVIGVILMVAITVILAGIIGVFVFGLADDVQGPKDVAVTSSTDGAGTAIILQSGKDIEELTAVFVKVNGTIVPTGVMYNGKSNTNGSIVRSAGVFSTGDVITIGNKTGNLLISGEFADGDSKVLLQKKL